MNLYRITNAISGAYLGDYQARTAKEALDLFAQDVGYEDYRAACKAAIVTEGEIMVAQLSGRIYEENP